MPTADERDIMVEAGVPTEGLSALLDKLEERRALIESVRDGSLKSFSVAMNAQVLAKDAQQAVEFFKQNLYDIWYGEPLCAARHLNEVVLGSVVASAADVESHAEVKAERL
jgi:hypothetical protein